MKNKFINLISLLPALLGEYVLIGNYLFFKPHITPLVDRVYEHAYGNNAISGEVFAFIYYGYLVSIALLVLCLIVLAILSWKEKTRSLLIATSVVSTIALFLVGFLLGASNSIYGLM